MSADRVAAALARLDEHRELHLPLRKSDVLGRLALRFLWKRQVKWQVETNLAIRDALDAVREQTRALEGGEGRLARHAELVHEVEQLRRHDQTMTAGMNQRLYSGLGRVESQLSELRLRQAESAEAGDDVEQRLKALETQVAALTSAATDVRLRHAQLDLALDRIRGGAEPAGIEVADRESFLELALSELLDGPADRVRDARRAHLPLVTGARESGATGPVFDAAPGRGEWLEVLRSAGLPFTAASGNALVRTHCAGIGLDVEAREPLAALAARPPRSLGAVTAFRFAERLAPDVLARFADLAATALQPGGVLVVETFAAEADLRLDPFARKPLPAIYLRFLAEAAGFADVEVRTAEATHGLGERLCLVARR